MVSMKLGLLLVACAAAINSGTVTYSGGKYTFVSGVDTSGVAFGTFDDALETTGWGVLTISTNSTFPDSQQMYAAGFLESSLTATRIGQMYLSMLPVYFGNATQPDPKVLAWLTAENEWAQSQVAANPHDTHWVLMGLILQQFNGLVAGYTGSVPVGLGGFLMLNAVGDLLDLIPALNHDQRPNFDKMDASQVRLWLATNTHCSGLIKILPDYSDLFAAHSSWFVYNAMNRIVKYYNFRLSNPAVAAPGIAFSSYPGFLSSLDDFYIMSSGLVMVQTTNGIFNMTLYDLVVPQSLLAWHRVRLANLWAKSGPEWYNIIKKYNSGTYNNQYMVVNYNLFTPGQMLVPDLLWVMEQIPGLVVGKDTTHELEFGYFPSYNIPYFKEIWEMSGYGTQLQRTGDVSLTWDLAPRAQIFRRDQTKVSSLATLKELMRYNDYESDPLSHDNPWDAICSRGDLATPWYTAGCYDTKVTNSTLMRTMTMDAINGPTYQQQTPFSWTTKYDGTAHFGQPQTFDFPFNRYTADFP